MSTKHTVNRWQQQQCEEGTRPFVWLGSRSRCKTTALASEQPKPTLETGQSHLLFYLSQPCSLPACPWAWRLLAIETKLLEWLPRRVPRCAQPQNLYFFMKNGFREAGTTRNMRFPQAAKSAFFKLFEVPAVKSLSSRSI